ncbi:radical SAM protein [Clostridioides difficile]
MNAFNNENIEVLNRNNKIIILNKENFSWVRMNELIYKKYSDNEHELNNMLRRYNILENNDLNNKDCTNIKSIYFALTRKCNMSCEFCSMKSSPNISIEEDLSIDEIKDIILKLKEINPRKIILTGGEPTIRRDFIELIDLFNEVFDSNQLILQSNGILLNDELIQLLSSKILRIDISIEGIFENKKLYEDFCKKFEYLKKEGMDIRFSFVINPDNKKYLEEAIDLSIKYKSNIDIRLVSPIGYALENGSQYLNKMDIVFLYKELIEMIIKRGYINKGIFDLKDIPLQPKSACGAYGRILSIYPDGNIYMCHSIPEESFSIGNIKNSSWEEINSKLNSKLKDENVENLLFVDKIPLCKDCSIKYFCTGICAATRLYCNDIDRLTVGCDMTKLLIDFNLFYYEKNISDLENLEEFLKHIDKYIEKNCCKDKVK